MMWIFQQNWKQQISFEIGKIMFHKFKFSEKKISFLKIFKNLAAAIS